MIEAVVFVLCAVGLVWAAREARALRPSPHQRCLRRIGQLEQSLFPRIPVEERWTTWFAGGSNVSVGAPTHPRSLMSYWLDEKEDTPDQLGYEGGRRKPPPRHRPHHDVIQGGVVDITGLPRPGDPFTAESVSQLARHEAMKLWNERLRRHDEQYDYIMRTYAERRTGRKSGYR